MKNKKRDSFPLEKVVGKYSPFFLFLVPQFRLAERKRKEVEARDDEDDDENNTGEHIARGVTARNTTTGTPFLRGRARMRRRNDRTAGAVLDSPSKRTVRTDARAPSSSEKKTTNGGNTKKKGEKERQQKIKEYWKDRRKVACQENDPMCLDIMRTPIKSFDEMEEEEQELNSARARVYGRNCDGGSE